MVRPDYAGAGLLNLIASLVEARGGRARHPTLEQLPPAEIAAARNVLLLIVDGLGDLYLTRRAVARRPRPGAGEPRHLHIGNHGGTSAEEMMIPLVVAAT